MKVKNTTAKAVRNVTRDFPMDILQDPEECRLQIGEFCCVLRFNDTDYAGSVRDYYKGFLSIQPPDLTIHVDIILHQDEVQVPDSLLASKTVEGQDFDFHHGLLKGSLTLKAKRCQIKVKNALLSGSSVRVFEQFLYQTYYTLLEERYPDIGNNYLLHSSAVRKEGLGYAFVGPPESGKSTVACLSNSYEVLNDEMVIVGKEDGEFQIRSTPFNGLFTGKVNGAAPLRAIFYLRHGDKNYLRPLKPTDFIGLAVREVVVPTPLLSEYGAKDLSNMTDFCAQLVSEVPCYEFYFVPDESIWGFIEESLRR